MKIGLFIKDTLDNIDELSTLLISKISEYNFEFDEDNPDVVIVLGGDGTLLRAINEYNNSLDSVSFVGVHVGTLGFAFDYSLEEIDSLFSDLAQDRNTCENVNLLQATYNGNVIYGINEIRIENPFHTLTSDVLINDELLENFRGNGLVVSTSFGSSGYNKSLGGAVVSPELNILQIKEIAPIGNRVYQSLNSPLVLSGDSLISFSGNFDECVVGYDHLSNKLSCVDRIDVRLSDKKVQLLYKNNHSFIGQIRKAFIK